MPYFATGVVQAFSPAMTFPDVVRAFRPVVTRRLGSAATSTVKNALLRVVKDQAERHSRTVGHGADAVPHHDAIVAARARGRPFARSEDDGRTLFDAHCVAARLRARTLLHKEKLAASIVFV